MVDSRLAKLKEAAKRKKEKAAAQKAPEKPEAPAPKAAPRKEEAPKPAPKKEPPVARAEPPPKPKREAPEPKARKAEPARDVESEVDEAFSEPEAAPKKQAPKKDVPKGPGPPSFEMDPARIRRNPSPGKYGKLIDLIRENEKLLSTQDVYAVLFACIKRYSEVEGKAKGIRDLVDEETKKYLESRKASPA